MSSEPTPISALLEKVREIHASPEHAERVAEHEREQRRLDRLESRRTWVRAGIPERLLDCVEAPKETPALDVVRTWLASGKTLLALLGPPDRGKSTAACWAAAQIGGRVIKAMDLIRHGTYDVRFWDALYAEKLVVVDDLGTEPQDEKGYALANVHALIDHAYDGRPRLVFTANLRPEAFVERYLKSDGERSLQRFRESGEIADCQSGAGFRPASILSRKV
jgi:DNA replication protein DnaC